MLSSCRYNPPESIVYWFLMRGSQTCVSSDGMNIAVHVCGLPLQLLSLSLNYLNCFFCSQFYKDVLELRDMAKLGAYYIYVLQLNVVVVYKRVWPGHEPPIPLIVIQDGYIYTCSIWDFFLLCPL